MKILKNIPLLVVFLFVSCSSVNVQNDYDQSVDFTQFKTFAFYKPGIDKVEVSDLDKKRILKSIENEMIAKGFTLSQNPDLLINFFTSADKQVDVNNYNNGYGYRWNPSVWGGNRTTVRTSTQGTLFIDLIDAKKKEMIWQGEGAGEIFKNQNNKEERIKEFVTEILKQYPPQKK